VDELLVKSLHSLQESKSAKTDVDEEGHYGEQIAATLHRFTPRQKALAKMKIQRISFYIEFDSEPPTYTPTNILIIFIKHNYTASTALQLEF
jgi:hypothetical protein